MTKNVRWTFFPGAASKLLNARLVFEVFQPLTTYLNMHFRLLPYLDGKLSVEKSCPA